MCVLGVCMHLTVILRSEDSCWTWISSFCLLIPSLVGKDSFQTRLDYIRLEFDGYWIFEADRKTVFKKKHTHTH